MVQCVSFHSSRLTPFHPHPPIDRPGPPVSLCSVVSCEAKSALAKTMAYLETLQRLIFHLYNDCCHRVSQSGPMNEGHAKQNGHVM